MIGYASKVVQALIELAKKSGGTTLNFLTNSENVGMTSIAKKLNFTLFSPITCFFLIEAEARKDIIPACSSSSATLATKWKKVESQEDLERILSSIAPFSSHFVTEFDVVPSNGFRVSTYIQDGSLYYLENPAAVMYMRPSEDYHGKFIICAVTTQDLEAAESGLYFTVQNSDPKPMRFFSVASIGEDHPLRKVSPLCQVFNQYTMDTNKTF